MPYVRIWISEDEKALLLADAREFASWLDGLQHKPSAKGIGPVVRQKPLPLAMSARNLFADGLQSYYEYGAPVTRTRWQRLASRPS